MGAPRHSAGRASDRTRALIIRAAEHEMARHGIEGADLQQINIAAGQRNTSAVHYHFGSRRGLVDAIIASHREPINADRNAMLDRLERCGTVTVDVLIAAMVQPITRGLDDPSRRDYIVILAEGSARLGTTGLFVADQPHSDSLRRLNGHLVDAIEGSPTMRRVRVGQAHLLAIVLLADVVRDIDHGRLTVAQGRRRVRQIIDLIEAALRGRAR